MQNCCGWYLFMSCLMIIKNGFFVRKWWFEFITSDFLHALICPGNDQASAIKLQTLLFKKLTLRVWRQNYFQGSWISLNQELCSHRISGIVHPSDANNNNNNNNNNRKTPVFHSLWENENWWHSFPSLCHQHSPVKKVGRERKNMWCMLAGCAVLCCAVKPSMS